MPYYTMPDRENLFVRRVGRGELCFGFIWPWHAKLAVATVYLCKPQRI